MKWKLPSLNIAPSKTEESLFEQIAQELASGHVKQGLWTKALADSDWDEAQAKSRYVKMRHEQMLSDFRQASKIQPQPIEDSPVNSADAAKEKARHFGLVDEQIHYLGVPILAVDYMRKYNISKKAHLQRLAP